MLIQQDEHGKHQEGVVRLCSNASKPLVSKFEKAASVRHQCRDLRMEVHWLFSRWASSTIS